MMDNHETFLINGVMKRKVEGGKMEGGDVFVNCLLYTSDAADEL